MKILLINLIIAILTLGLPLGARAQVTLTLQPSPQTINVGDSAAMDLVVSGLSSFSAPSLGAFDIDVSYNAAILSAVSLTFGDFLDLGAMGSLRSSDLNTDGAIHLDEVSFESSADLSTTQPDSFTLATLHFNGLAPGISAVAFTFASLSDEQGQSLTFSTTVGSMEVVRLVAVPDAGSTFPLLLLGIVGLWAVRRFPQRWI